MKNFIRTCLCLVSILMASYAFSADSAFGNRIALGCSQYISGGPSEISISPEDVKEWQTYRVSGKYLPKNMMFAQNGCRAAGVCSDPETGQIFGFVGRTGTTLFFYRF